MTLYPRMATPMLLTSDLARLVQQYHAEFGFQVVQQIPAVAALLALGPVRLQLWQGPRQAIRDCRIELAAASGQIFDLHGRLASRARSAIAAGGPHLRSWGAWEFSLCDGEAHRLIFVEWAARAATASRPDVTATPRRRNHP